MDELEEKKLREALFSPKTTPPVPSRSRTKLLHGLAFLIGLPALQWDHSFSNFLPQIVNLCYTLWGESRTFGLAEFETLFPWFRIVTSFLFRSGACRLERGH